MADLKPVSPGQPIVLSAGDHNAMLDAARAHRARQVMKVGESAARQQAGIILVKNNTASNRDFLDVMAVDVPLILPTESLDEWSARVAFSCVDPGSTHAGRYVVLQEPIAAGELGRAMVIGVTPVNLDVVDEAHRYAEVDTGATGSLITKASGSARILWKESGTGSRRAVVMLSGEPGADPSFPPVYNGWTENILTAVDVYEVTDLGGATQAILEVAGGGGGGGYGPVGINYTGGGGGASGPVITTHPFKIALGDLIEVVAIGAGGTGGTSGAQVGTTGGETVASATNLGVVNTESGGLGGGGGGGIFVKGKGGSVYVPATPYAQRSNPGFNSGYADYGAGGVGLRGPNYGGGGNGGVSGNGQDGYDGVVCVWSNGTGLVLTPV